MDEQELMRATENMIKAADAGKIRAEAEANNMYASNISKDGNLVEYQLELEREYDTIYHLLRGDELVTNENGDVIWQDPRDDRLRTLTDYGVKKIMQLFKMYVNKNTLLSNYQDMIMINWKVKDFGIELADLIYTQLEMFFYHPSPDELFEKFKPYAEQYGISEYELYKKCEQWSFQELQQRVRQYPILVLSVIDMVHSAYLRAYHGEERKSLRSFIHVSQSPQMPGQQMMVAKKWSKPSTWLN